MPMESLASPNRASPIWASPLRRLVNSTTTRTCVLLLSCHLSLCPSYTNHQPTHVQDLHQPLEKVMWSRSSLVWFAFESCNCDNAGLTPPCLSRTPPPNHTTYAQHKHKYTGLPQAAVMIIVVSNPFPD